MPPLEQTLSSMSLSLSLHSNNNDNDTYHHMKHSSVSRQTKRHSITGSSTTSILPITTNISTTTTTEQRMMNELRTAKDGCIGSIMALLHFLSQHGVAASSICEETKQLKRISEQQQQQQQETIASHTTILTQSSSTSTSTIIIPYESMVRKIIKYYLVCINKHIREVQEVDTIHMLILGCWQTQYRYAKILYLYAHQYYNTIRFKNTNNSTINTANNTNYTIKQQQQQQQQNQQQQQQGTTIITASSYQYCDNKSTVLKKALQYQIQMAEYVCTCQKEILSCQRKYERQQQQQQRQQVQLQ